MDETYQSEDGPHTSKARVESSDEYDSEFDFSSSEILPNLVDEEDVERGEEDSEEQAIDVLAVLTLKRKVHLTITERRDEIINKLLSTKWTNREEIFLFGRFAVQNKHWLPLNKLSAQLDMCKLSTTRYGYAYFSDCTLPPKAGLRLSDYFFRTKLWILGYSLLACVIRFHKKQHAPAQMSELLDFGDILNSFDDNYWLPKEVVDIFLTGKECWPQKSLHNFAKRKFFTYPPDNVHTDLQLSITKLIKWLNPGAMPNAAAYRKLFEQAYKSTQATLPIISYVLTSCELARKDGQQPYIKTAFGLLEDAQFVVRSLIAQGHFLLGYSLLAATIKHEVDRNDGKPLANLLRILTFLKPLLPDDNDFDMPAKIILMFREGKAAWHPDLLKGSLALKLMKN